MKEQDDADGNVWPRPRLQDVAAVDQIGIHTTLSNFEKRNAGPSLSISWRNTVRGAPKSIAHVTRNQVQGLLDYAMTLGADYVATGHYARKWCVMRMALFTCFVAWTMAKDSRPISSVNFRKNNSKNHVPIGTFGKTEVQEN